MGSPLIQYSDVAALAAVGGYSTIAALDNLSAAFLLSSCLVMRQRWLWQSPLVKISDATWQDINSMIDEAVYQLMSNFAVGQIIQSVADLSSYDQVLELDGSTVLVADYPTLASVVPASWIVGSDINLPDMSDAGIFGDGVGSVGTFFGENDVTLTESEMPVHTHIQNSHTHTEVIPSIIPTAAGLEPALASLVTAVPSITGATVATNQTAGSGNSHNNIQRSLLVKWWIIAK